MTQALKAIYDGEVFRPEEPVKIPAHTSVELLVHTAGKEKKKNGQSFLKEIAALNLHGPSDWSENFEDYLNGDRKPK
ncbi:MAG TPA: antitoxin AF2212-like protein [Verrucomicrobiae bacterium]|jgi:hypothetical protein